jgi:hypothetical protein
VKRVLRWAGAVVGLLVVVLLAILAWGTGLPVDHVATCSAAIGRDPKTLYDTVEDDGESPAWRPDVVRVMRSQDLAGHPVWVEVGAHGMSMQYDETVSSSAAGRIVRRIDEPGAPFGGTWTYTFISQGPRAAVIAIREDGEIYNPLFRFLSKYFFGYTSTMRTFIADLAEKYGEHPTISCSP